MAEAGNGIEFDAWIASACLPATLLRQLLEQYGDSFSCYQAVMNSEKDITDVIPPRFVRILKQNGAPDKLTEKKILLDKYSINVIRFSYPEFPESLMNISEPPAILFYQGELECIYRKTVAMVGSRAASYSGQKATRKVAEDLSRNGVTVVSGLACGIDAAAHQGCVEGGSPTIAVTGCGLDRVYPSDNNELKNRILENGGLLLSEYAPGEKPAGWHFPVRNRIITGLSRALILMEARIRSGSMTSVQHALDQGKDVFVYPGDPSSDQFDGNHQLLREGGIYFTCAEDILSDLHWLDNPSAVRHNIGCSVSIGNFSTEQRSVIEALKPGSQTFEELISRTGLDPSALMGTITVLQIRGMIEAIPGKQYILKK